MWQNAVSFNFLLNIKNLIFEGMWVTDKVPRYNPKTILQRTKTQGDYSLCWYGVWNQNAYIVEVVEGITNNDKNTTAVVPVHRNKKSSKGRHKPPKVYPHMNPLPKLRQHHIVK